MSQSGKLMPNLDQNSTKLLNLTVLQRIDPYIEEILITAAHVTFYEFNIDLNQWSRKDVEGSLFVVKRNTQPRFQFIVMNRRNTDNLVENLLGDFEFELQAPYLLYRNADQEVNGIWFYNRRECEEVANLFNRILSAYSKVPPKPKSPSISEFEELEAVPTTAVIEGPLEPSFSAPSSTDVPDDSSFVNFFNSAMNIGHNAPVMLHTGQPYHISPNIPLCSHVPSVTTSPAPPLKVPSVPFPASSTPPAPLHDIADQMDMSNRVTNLVKPSSFFPMTSSPMLMTPPLSSPLPTAYHPPLNQQRPHGTPLLQPFPPPTPPPAPPPSLTPGPTTTPSLGQQINREKVRNALLMLVQDNQFIDMVCQALLRAHQS
ncbi:MRNA-decapping enzyme-like protein [Actinidia chinensis var. chinensis]|uniref:mRNA-decapping enzyme-like protein n=1 Tax=Actinidia chinensis var. chinensis TaxID=1590841 RepID=A0A2R6Q4G6_ACTCC|nr:MRNA-decapping enzyme-like protein [Actinidia chinensis var. chinensis]